MNPQIYCTAPFNGLTIRENGDVRTCCVGNNTLGNLNNISIDQIEQSHVMREIQQDMLSNNPNLKNCKTCLNQEKNYGLATLRQHYLKYYPTVNPDTLTLKFIDVRWNNTCNLGCLYCNSDFSSIWENRLGISRSSLSKPYQDKLLDWILARIDHVEEIMLVGGEPMLMKQNYELLRCLPDTTRISIITNLSYDLEKLPCLPDLLRRPADNVLWNISMENTNERFEYVRSGASWAQVEKNLNFLIKHWKSSISLNMVYSVFSAFDLPDTVEYFDHRGIQKFNLFPINQNSTLNIKNLPVSIQKLAFDQLLKTQQRHLELLHPEDRNLFPLQGADSLLNSLSIDRIEHPITLSEFDEKIKWYDQWGDKKFADLWPDIAQLIRRNL